MRTQVQPDLGKLYNYFGLVARVISNADKGHSSWASYKILVIVQ